jgi:hypothetical protein
MKSALRLTFFAAATLAAGLSLSSQARAEDDAASTEISRPRLRVPARAEPADRPAPAPRNGPEVNLALGLRGMLVPSAGYDPYSNNDVLAQTSISAGVTFLKLGRVSFAASLEWNFGRPKALARGHEASLAVHRFAGALESRFTVGQRLYLFAKAAPAAIHMRGSIANGGIDRPLVALPWTWSLDTTGGGALLIGRTGDPRAPTSRWWLTAEAGYAFAGLAEMNYVPASNEEDPRQFGAVALPAIRPAGPVLRLAFAVSF